MRSKVERHSEEAEKTVREIRRATRRQYSAEEKIRIVIAGLRAGGAPHAGPPPAARPPAQAGCITFNTRRVTRSASPAALAWSMAVSGSAFASYHCAALECSRATSSGSRRLSSA